MSRTNTSRNSAEYEDYMSFLCSLPNTDPSEVTKATGGSCIHSFDNPSDLNTPSVTISGLVGSLSVHRKVQNVANKPETYVVAVVPPNGVMVNITPTWFTLAPQEIQDLELKLNVTQALDDYSFGEVVLTGDLNHVVRIPLSVWAVSISLIPGVHL